MTSRRPSTAPTAPTGPAGNAVGNAGGTLYAVATPIGNLADVTLRALEVLRAVPLIACEDTRITRRLLARHGIEGRLVSFHARSGPGRLAELLEHLRSGADLALATDAGTPGVSDPGEELVASWAAEGGRVVPIPGPSAVLAAVVGSGVAGPRWGFEGFLPRAGRERRERLARLAADDRGVVVYEAANRLGPTLAALAEACGTDRPAAVARELTKVHEQIVRGRLGELVTAVAAGAIPLRGEVVIVLGGRVASQGEPARRDDEAGLDAARAAVDALAGTGVSRAEAARRVARESGLRRRDLYRRS